MSSNQNKQKLCLAASLICIVFLLGMLWCSKASAQAEEQLILPSHLKVIAEEAFAGDSSITTVVLPEMVEQIHSRAFARTSLTEVVFPESLNYIAPNAFEECEQLKAWVAINSYAHLWCEENEIDYGFAFPVAPGCALTYTIAHDEVTITGFQGNPVMVTLPSTIGGYPVTAIANEAFYDCISLSNIILPNSIITIGDDAFSWCTKLTSIVIPANTTSIGDYAFWNCTELNSIALPASLQEIGNGAFEDCNQLCALVSYGSYAHGWCAENGIVLEIDPLSVKEFTYIVNEGNITLTEYLGNHQDIVLPSALGKNQLTAIGDSAFAGNTVMSSLILPDTITSIGNEAFQNCTGIKELTLSENVKSIGSNAFAGCTQLTITVVRGSYAHSWCVANEVPVTYIATPESYFTYTVTEGEATITGFSGNQTEIIIPSVLAGNPVTSIAGYAFGQNCLAEEIVVCEGITTIQGSAFFNCPSLKKVELPASITNVEGRAFSSCYFLTEIVVDSRNTTYTSMDGLLYSKDRKTLCCVPPGKKGRYTLPEGVTTIAACAFMDSTITELTLPDSLTSIGRNAFSYNRYLVDIIIPEQVTVLEAYTFSGCSALASVELKGVKNINESVFTSCTALEKIEMPVVETIGEQAFYNCDALVSVTLPESLTSLGTEGFYASEKLSDVIFACADADIGSSAFESCNNLSNVQLPHMLTKLQNRVFYSCDNLKTIELPDSLQVIGNSAFSGSGLVNVRFGSQLKEIQTSAFSSCSLQNVQLSEGLTSIGSSAFSYNSDLKVINFPASLTAIDKYALSNSKNVTATVVLDSYAQTWCEENSISYVLLAAPASSFTYNIVDQQAMISGFVGNETDFVVPSTIEGYPVTMIGDRAFEDSSDVVRITLPDSVVSIGVRAFEGCTSLKKINLSNELTSIGRLAFADCSSLYADVNYGSYAHLWCNDNGVDYAISSVPEVDSLNYEIRNGQVYLQRSILYETEIILPRFIEGIPVEFVEDDTFSGYRSITRVIIQEGTSWIGSYAFAFCSKLSSVVIPASVDYIGSSAFQGCSDLVATVIADSYAHTWCEENGVEYVFGDETSIFRE